MNRKVLLIEPNYKNKYPPMGLMKISTYFRNKCKDEVRFFKGDLNLFASQLLFEEFYKEIEEVQPHWRNYFNNFINFIKIGKYSLLDDVPNFRGSKYEEIIKNYREQYKLKNIPKFDIICITTLFTFYWKKSIETIRQAQIFVKPDGKIFVGGVAATILDAEMKEELKDLPQIEMHKGLLNSPKDLHKNDDIIIDELPLDYSILDEIDYKYPASDAYFGYMTRGCIRHCAFCAVPTLEPDYKNYVSIKKQITEINKNFGEKKDLLLMDNNVFASDQFDKIIDEIKEIGFAKGATYMPPNEYEIAYRNLKSNINEKAYINKIIKIYNAIDNKLSENEAGNFYIEREKLYLLHAETATKTAIENFDPIARSLYNKYFKHSKRQRHIDFNQGLDARLATDEKMKKLSEINIKPLRIAFDHYEQRDIYARAIRLAAKYGIKDLSNYLLYNFLDKPEDLYYRMKLNIDLCEELQIRIFSFPMKYHPIHDPDYFDNRDYIGKHWNRKFIRSIQSVLNSTKGKISRKRDFFEKAFGKNVDEFYKILWMPESFIIYRNKYENNGLTEEWFSAFNLLNNEQRYQAKKIIRKNDFSDEVLQNCNFEVRNVLKYYQIKND